MKKKFTLILFAVLASMPVIAQPALGRWNTRASATEPERVECGATQSEPIVVIDEDFSLFTAGSETTPDDEDITTSNYYVKDEYTHLPKWIGYNVHQAGGVCALLAWTDAMHGSGYGHISTPEKELYGEVTLTFKARRAHSNPNSGRMWIALCNNSYGIIQDTTYALKDEWQEFEWVLTNTDFSNRCIFQFTPQQGEALVDDIKVVRNRTIIPPVEVLNPLNNSETEFIARWRKSDLPEIDGYLMNVYYKDFPAEEIESGSLEVDFESLNVLADGKSIDTANPGYPEGWTIDVSTHGDVDVRTDEGYYNSGKQAIFFDAPGDIIRTPVTPAPISCISFWVRPTNMEPESYEFSLVGIQVKHTDGEWERIANVPNYWMEEKGGYYVLDGDVVGEQIYQVEILCETSYKVDFAIDDIRIDYEVQPVPFPLITDKFVTDTFCVVQDIDPTKEHFYNVRVKEGDIESKKSSDMWVDGLIGVVPTALPATDVTETSFTANWEAINTASEYKLSVDQTMYTTRNDEDVVMVHEDFSELTEGTVLSPHDEWTMVYNINDIGRTELEWLLTSPQWINGMAGSRGTHSTGLAGLVLGPKMKLDDYEIEVVFSARNTKRDDVLWVMLMEEYHSTNAVAALSVPMTKVALMTDTVVFPAQDWGDAPLRVAFMCEKGGAFYIDEVKVSCRVPHKGTPVERPYKSLIKTETSQTFTDIPDYAPTYTYRVTARRTKNFVEYVSEPSEPVVVTLPTELEAVEGNNNRVYVSGDVLHVQVANDARVEVYNLQGMVVASYEAMAGENTYSVAPGMYLVKVEDSVYKVIVR